jgi:hypothetical protein
MGNVPTTSISFLVNNTNGADITTGTWACRSIHFTLKICGKAWTANGKEIAAFALAQGMIKGNITVFKANAARTTLPIEPIELWDRTDPYVISQVGMPVITKKPTVCIDRSNPIGAFWSDPFHDMVIYADNIFYYFDGKGRVTVGVLTGSIGNTVDIPCYGDLVTRQTHHWL